MPHLIELTYWIDGNQYSADTTIDARDDCQAAALAVIWCNQQLLARRAFAGYCYLMGGTDGRSYASGACWSAHGDAIIGAYAVTLTPITGNPQPCTPE